MSADLRNYRWSERLAGWAYFLEADAYSGIESDASETAALQSAVSGPMGMFICQTDPIECAPRAPAPLHTLDSLASSAWRFEPPTTHGYALYHSQPIWHLNESGLRRLAIINPAALLTLINRGALSPPQLTFAAEAAGSISDSPSVVATLLPLLDHASSLVREGAIYGLENHASDDAVKKRLQLASETDPSPGVRAVAYNLISE